MAPAESSMPTTGTCILPASSTILAIFREWDSPAEPARMVKSVEYVQTFRPFTSPYPMITPSAGVLLSFISKSLIWEVTNIPIPQRFLYRKTYRSVPGRSSFPGNAASRQPPGLPSPECSSFVFRSFSSSSSIFRGISSLPASLIRRGSRFSSSVLLFYL